MTNRSQMSSILCLIGPEQLVSFALKLGKIAEINFVYILASTNINQSAPNLVIMYMTITSQNNWIMDQIRPGQSELYAFGLESCYL